MNTESSIVIRAPKQLIFEVTSDLSRWPELLPHYRYIDYLQRGNDRHIVRMAASRDGIPISWVSEQIIDHDRLEIHFVHLKAFTKGMKVVWTFDEKPEGTLVRIVHILKFRIPALAPLADPIIGGFFIDNIANKTLRAFKAHLEATV
ncbi:MAG TPA: SRPBCC family protein [Chthoniobacterales bacterium]|nr:SRPBCC family protein [Chthoniobacterales bacterium]